MKVNDRLTIESDRDESVRSYRYYVETFDMDGNAVSRFNFYVHDNGHMWQWKQDQEEVPPTVIPADKWLPPRKR